MATGRGSTLGAALVDMLGGTPVKRASYDRTGWRAQFSQLSSTRAGYAAMERAGLSATIATQRGWLAGTGEASAANRGKIAEAYRQMAAPTIDPRAWENRQIEIRGRLTQGRDSRVRGSKGSAPLRLQFPGDPLTNWDEIARVYAAGADPGEIEEAFVAAVVNACLGMGSHPWQFDGNSYEVSA